MPGTFMISSIFLKGPFFWRYSMIFWAVTGPISGRLSNSARVAVLMLISLLIVGERVSGQGVPGSGVSGLEGSDVGGIVGMNN